MFEPLVERNPKPYAVACWALCACVGGLLAGELGHWAPAGPALVSVHAAVLAAMGAVAWRLQDGSLDPDPRRGAILGWLGGAYMALALGRIAIGLAIAGAAPWFKAWLPAFFHVAFAGYVLALSAYDRREPAPF